MPDLMTEIAAVQHTVLLASYPIINVRDAKAEFGPLERGLDVVFDLEGHRCGVQHTVYHFDEGQTPSRRGSPARSAEEANRRRGALHFAWTSMNYEPSLSLRIKEKIAIAALHDNRDLVSETWLLISASLGKNGAAASTYILPERLRTDDLHRLYHADLHDSKFDAALLTLHANGIVYGWDRSGGWRLVADRDAVGRAEGKAVVNSLMSSISSRW